MLISCFARKLNAIDKQEIRVSSHPHITKSVCALRFILENQSYRGAESIKTVLSFMTDLAKLVIIPGEEIGPSSDNAFINLS